MPRRSPGSRAVLGLAGALTGCGPHGAPSLVLFGAYFPGWMACALIGVAGAIGARILMVASGLSAVLPLQLLVCASVGVIVAIGVWLPWFGR